ncbi:FG-GAP-like repeat-containing protein [Streptomyces albogriseolus]|uniref:FG-GAP-like repeat-containing protein n=1 Tax=Streptomyces albogriseolus TaxID=1887 RepID=UPI00225817A2|nr:FG-GAP-like repeat-containing protein [Streptomyces viridodiastaticus]MCX4568551.1 FG-GAP-like repeat-containing protein [Streptomyces viridodiastaticus]
MRKHLKRGVAALVGLTLAGTGLTVATAAPAAASSYDCPSGYFCGWSGESTKGTMWKTSRNVADLGGWDDKIRSYVNRTSLIACLYDDKNYVPWGGYFPQDPNTPGEYSSSPTATISSIKFVRTERECSQPAYPSWYSEPSPTAAGFGDMNGDRRADVITRDLAGRLWFTPGDATGRLIGSGGWNAMNTLTRHGDFTGDGREDLIAREKATGTLWLYPGTGTGSLGARTLLGASGWNSMNHITAYGDLTGDGRSDLIAVQKSTGALWLYPGASGSRLGARKLIGSGGWNGMNALAGMGDVTGDGRPDLYAREKATGKLWLYPGTSTARLGSRQLVGSGGWNTMEHLISVGDFSGDGRPDLATVTNRTYVIDGFEGNPGWLITYRGRAGGTLYGPERTHGEWWGLSDFC